MIRNPVILLHGYWLWIRRLPHATEMMFSAHTTVGRVVKIFLFGLGIALPLGSLIWILLFWHGNYIRKSC